MDLNLTEFNWVDYLLFGILIFSLLVGLMRGFMREFVSLLVWTTVFLMAIMYATQLPVIFGPSGATSSTSAIVTTIDFLAIIIVTLIFGNLLENFLTNMGTRRVGFISRFFGAILGLIRGGVLVLILMLVVNVTPAGKMAEWQTAKSIHESQPVVKRVEDAVSPHFGDMKSISGDADDKSADTNTDTNKDKDKDIDKDKPKTD